MPNEKLSTPNRGMACMFTMMNQARLSVALQGVAIAERATQQAPAYARERKPRARRGNRTPGETSPRLGQASAAYRALSRLIVE
jgi:alkylation response protein AidB-like acyl-CoA dehydrogenase